MRTIQPPAVVLFLHPFQFLHTVVFLSTCSSVIPIGPTLTAASFRFLDPPWLVDQTDLIHIRQHRKYLRLLDLRLPHGMDSAANPGEHQIHAQRCPTDQFWSFVDYSPLQELTHQSVPEQALYTAMHPNNLRNTTATEHEALFTYARILEPNEIPNVQIQHLRPLMVIRLRTQWGIDFLASDLEFRYADLTGDVFQVPNTTTILDLLNEYRPDWRFRQYNYIHSTTLVPGTTTPFILRLQCHKVSQGVILPWAANAQ